MKKRVALVVGSPAPWDPGFEGLARSERYEFKAFYRRPSQSDMDWTIREIGYPFEVLRNWAPRAWRSRSLVSDFNPGIWPALHAFRPEAVVVHGYATLTDLLAITWAKANRAALLMRTDSNVLDDETLTPHRRTVKRALLRSLASRTAAVLSVGTLNGRYWESYGVAPEKIFHAPFAIDVPYFRDRTAELRSSREEIRGRNGWTERYLVLFVGRLVQRKRVDLLIDALRRLSARRSDIGLLVAGDGVERHALERSAGGLTRVRFLGFRDRKELPGLFAASDVLACPSQSEPWGLVVGEAMAAGLPVISNRRVGAAHDLVANGVNGYTLAENEVGPLSEAIEQACRSEEHLREMGLEAARTMERWSVEAYLAGCHRALDHCLGV